MLAIIGDGLIDLLLTCSQTEIAGPILLALTATKVGSAFETITIVISEHLSDRLSLLGQLSWIKEFPLLSCRPASSCSSAPAFTYTQPSASY